MATQGLMPFAPHAAEEIWQHLGLPESLRLPLSGSYQEIFRRCSGNLCDSGEREIARPLDLPKDKNQEEIFALAKDLRRCKRFLEGQKIAKVIFVPNKLLNIVI